MKSVAWVAPLDEDAGEAGGMEMIREQQQQHRHSTLALTQSECSLLDPPHRWR